MRRIILLFITLATPAFGQMIPIHISPDEAESHLTKKPSATYPPLAEATHISGNVILQISVDESGSASVQRVISGHPLLVQTAIQAANQWKYRPFEVAGKPAKVVTVVMVAIGNAHAQDASSRAEMLFQDQFWTAADSALELLEKGDYAGSEAQLNKAQEQLPKDSSGGRNAAERWQWANTMGQLRMLQKNYPESELYYRKALSVYQSGDKDAPEIASSLANLGKLFAEEKQFDIARDEIVRSVAIYKKNFKSVSSGNLSARQVYGRAIAYQSWMLWNFASQRNDPVDANKQCQTVAEFQSFLSATDRESFIPACEQAIKNPPAKP